MQNHILSSLFHHAPIVLYRQPIVKVVGQDAADLGSSLHYEVLTKFKDKHKLVNLAPQPFIETLETYNLQVELDSTICKKAISWILRNDKTSDTVYHLNISPKSTQFIPKLLDRYAPDIYKRISFELTENSTYDNNLVKSLKDLNYLRSLGVSISFDDFGSRHNSFATLQAVSPDYIKIDGMFVKNALTCKFSETVVSSIVKLAKVLGAATIAESVENQVIADFMVKLGVDYLQGWHVGLLEEMTDRE